MAVSSEQQATNPVILIVDDMEVNLELLEARLEGSGYEVTCARNGIEALEILKTDSFDMIISDILMPKMDGYQLCRECKRDDTLRKIPFVFYTATYTDKKDVEFALSLGAERYIVKSMEHKPFMEIIEDILKNYEKGLMTPSEIPAEKEEAVYLQEYNERLVKKLEKKMLDLEREVTERKRAEEMPQKRTYDLNERVKELNCLYGISKLVEEQEISLEEITQGVVNLIPPAWQYPEIACARVILEAQEFRTGNFKETVWKQASDIKVHGEWIGTVEVYYLEEKSEIDEGPFVKEEKALIIAIAERLGRIIERKRAEERLSESEKKFKELFDGSNDAIFVANPQTRKLVDCNKQAQEITGYSRKEILSMRADQLHPKDKVKKTMEGFKKHAAGELSFVESEILTKDKKRIPVNINASTVEMTGKKYVQGIYRDITERKQAEEKIKEYSENLERKALELEKMNIEIQKATRLKSQFLANMSHELRTPLNSIIGFTGIILQGIVGELNDEQKKQLNMVYDSAKHLLGLINDILDLSKIEAGKIEIIPAQFEVKGLIQTVGKMVLPMIEEKGLTFEVAISEDVPLTICNDKNRIKQVLINLLSNAAKFTESGEIRLTVEKAQSSKLKAQREGSSFQLSASDFELHRDWIQISVQDTGIGIKLEHLSDVFDEFRQIEDPLKDKPVGTGLGLAISRKMVEMMGGRIWAESEYGKGSCFQFTIPIKERRRQEDRLRSSLIPETLDLSKKLVLTIDDEVGAQEILKTYLKSEGYEVIQAYNAMEAMELAGKYRPFAITLDIIMPGKDGWDILHDLKKNPRTQGIPVICISILDNQEMGLSLGAIEYMVKPIDKDQLIEELRQLEKRFRIYDILIVDDEPQAVQLLTQYLTEADNYTVRKAYGGEEGLSRVKESRPDLIILDLMMPEVDGFEVIRHLKKSDVTRDIPIIIVSAKKLTQEEIEYLNSNIEKIIRKEEFSKKDLLKDIKRALEKIV